MVVMLRQCCCGCTLKTGTIILGVINTLAAVGYLISGIFAASYSTTVGRQHSVNTGELATAGIVLCVFAAILLLFAVCLIIGAVQGSPVLLIPWMFYSIIYMIVNTVLSILSAVQYFNMSEGVTGAITIVLAITVVLLQTYFLLVVYSLYRELKGTAPHNNA